MRIGLATGPRNGTGTGLSWAKRTPEDHGRGPGLRGYRRASSWQVIAGRPSPGAHVSCGVTGRDLQSLAWFKPGMTRSQTSISAVSMLPTIRRPCAAGPAGTRRRAARSAGRPGLSSRGRERAESGAQGRAGPSTGRLVQAIMIIVNRGAGVKERLLGPRPFGWGPGLPGPR